MGAVTYPDPNVQRYVNEYFVPVQLNVREQPDAMDRFHAMWTPTVIVEDADGTEHRRTSGYLDPKRFLGELALGRMKAAIDRQQPDEARRMAGDLLRTVQGDPTREPEALYWSAVADYKATDDANQLKQGWQRLQQQYPDSEWAQRSDILWS